MRTDASTSTLVSPSLVSTWSTLKLALRKKLVCVTCRQKITFPEGKFCWGNEARFGGFQYCREHQAQFK